MRQDAMEVVGQLRAAGHEAYFAGGCVRDQLLGLAPKDFDVATSARPEVVRGLFRKTQAVGAAFGVILVRLGRSVIEVATFRIESDYSDGRRPGEVRFATAQEDAQRRDFTINGLFLDPVTNRVIDYVGGQEDITAKRLRAIGVPEERFAEDHLRLLRAVRFAARFGLAIDPATAAAMKLHAPLLRRISPERIADELRRMLTPATRNMAWRMLWEYALVDTIWRFLPTVAPVEWDTARCPFVALPQEGEGEGAIGFGLALAAACLSYRLHAVPAEGDVAMLLAHGEVAGLCRAMRQTLRLSNEELEAMRGTLEGAGMMLSGELRVAKYKRFASRASAADSRRLLESLRRLGMYVQRIDEVLRHLVALDGTEVAPAPWVTGDDLLQLGAAPGPVYKQLLDALYDAQLEHQVKDQAEAMVMAKHLVEQAVLPARQP